MGNGVCAAKGRQQLAELLVVQMELAADFGFAQRHRLPVEIGEHRGGEQHERQPPFPCDGCAAWWASDRRRLAGFATWTRAHDTSCAALVLAPFLTKKVTILHTSHGFN